MPHRPVDKLSLPFPDWIEEHPDSCLREQLKEALVARLSAVRAGAMEHRGARPIVQAADSTVEQIEYGRVAGDQACRKAATATRKYTQALAIAEAATPRRKHRGAA